MAAVAMVIASCGGSDGDSGSDAGAEAGGGDASDTFEFSEEELAELDDFAEAVAEAQGAGGGGTLTFDGVETVIESAVCQTDGVRFDVGTVGPEGYRVFVSGEADDPNLQILTPEGVQWFDGDPFQENKPTVVIDGNMITSTGGTFFNNGDDVLIVAEFAIECPNPVL